MCDFFKAAAKLFKEDEKYKLKENQLIIEKIYATKNKKLILAINASLNFIYNLSKTE